MTDDWSQAMEIIEGAETESLAKGNLAADDPGPIGSEPAISGGWPLPRNADKSYRIVQSRSTDGDEIVVISGPDGDRRVYSRRPDGALIILAWGTYRRPWEVFDE